VKKGVIAVHLAWYRLLKGSQLYVPGYGIGTIADTGAYPYNNYWIDLGFTDAEFALYGKFYKSITVYFLAPAPPNVPGILP
jgi:3D (Asp-Asp-Asp) domain-containing protein